MVGALLLETARHSPTVGVIQLDIKRCRSTSVASKDSSFIFSKAGSSRGVAGEMAASEGSAGRKLGAASPKSTVPPGAIPRRANFLLGGMAG